MTVHSVQMQGNVTSFLVLKQTKNLSTTIKLGIRPYLKQKNTKGINI